MAAYSGAMLTTNEKNSIERTKAKSVQGKAPIRVDTCWTSPAPLVVEMVDGEVATLGLVAGEVAGLTVLSDDGSTVTVFTDSPLTQKVVLLRT